MRKTRVDRMTKRRFVELLGTLGVGSAVLHGSSQEAVAEVTDDPEKQVPRVKGYRHTNREAMENGAKPKREPVFWSVPRSDWVDVTATRNAVRGIGQRFRDSQIRIAASPDRQSPTGLKIAAKWVVTETVDGGERKPSIPFEEFEKRVPPYVSGTAGKGKNQERVENIPVFVEKVRAREQGLIGYYDDRYDRVPGGCQHTRGELTSGCTLCAPAFDNDKSGYVMVTAAHCVGWAPGADVYQPHQFGTENKIGQAEKIARDGDAATVTLINRSPKLSIAGRDGTYDWDIWGIRTSESLWYMMVYGYGLYQQGRTTGRNFGWIKQATYTDVYLDVDTEGGDSGGPYFDEENGIVYLAGIHGNEERIEEGDPEKHAVGRTVEWAEDSLNVTF